jgi:hypothetical protein
MQNFHVAFAFAVAFAFVFVFRRHPERSEGSPHFAFALLPRPSYSPNPSTLPRRPTSCAKAHQNEAPDSIAFILHLNYFSRFWPRNRM